MKNSNEIALAYTLNKYTLRNHIKGLLVNDMNSYINELSLLQTVIERIDRIRLTHQHFESFSLFCFRVTLILISGFH